MRFTWWRIAFITLFALTAGACGAGGGKSAVLPTVMAPGPVNGGKFNVAGFTATFTEYPVPPGITPVDVTIGPDGALWFGNFHSFDSSAIAMGTLTASGSVRTITLPAVNDNGLNNQLFSGSGAIASAGGALWSVATDPGREDESLLIRTTPVDSVTAPGDLGVSGGSPVQKIIVDPNGNLWIAACQESCPEFSAVVESFTTSGTAGVFVRLGSVPQGITFGDNSLAAGPDHNIYVTAVYTGVPGGNPLSSDSSVFQISTSGTVLHQFALPDGSDPIGIAAGPDGNLWIAENGTNKIVRMTTSGTVTEFPIPPPGAGPQMITVGSDGALWFTENPGNALGRITVSGAITQYPIPTPNAHPFGIVSCPSACENAHGRIWFAEEAGKIGKFEF